MSKTIISSCRISFLVILWICTVLSFRNTIVLSPKKHVKVSPIYIHPNHHFNQLVNSDTPPISQYIQDTSQNLETSDVTSTVYSNNPSHHTHIFKSILSILVSLVVVIPISASSTNADSFSYRSSIDTKVSSVISSSDFIANENTLRLSLSSSSSLPVFDILADPLNRLRSGVTGEKVTEIRVGESLVRRLRSVEQELDQIQKDIFAENVDWEVISVYPKIFRTYAPLFTAYTDRAFPSTSPVDASLRYALRYEIGGFYNGIKDFEDAVNKKSQRQLQRAFAKICLAYDRYYKAGDLYLEYDTNRLANSLRSSKDSTSFFGLGGTDRYFDQETAMTSKLTYIAPSIEAPSLQDEVILLKGPDKGRVGKVLWIAKGENVELSNVVIKFDTISTNEGHHEVKLYPYTFVAKTTPPEVQFLDDLLAAYIASAISCGIMYPIDSYKTRLQIGKKGLPSVEEGGWLGLYKGVQYFIADANDAIYVASYGLIKPVFLAPVDPTNGLFVFMALVLSGSAGDALGSIFRVPMEIVYKRIQAGISDNGIKVLLSFGSKSLPIRSLLICWAAVLLRDMPFAGLQIALYDIYKNLFAFLDELGWSMFAQSALWGVLAGGTAAWLTTPFDVLTTNILTAIEEDDEPLPESSAMDIPLEVSSVSLSSRRLQKKSSTKTMNNSPSSFQDQLQTSKELVKYFLKDTSQLFQKSFRDVISKEDTLGGQVGALFNGAFERVLFFGPAAMIFFTTYESAFNIISVARERHGLWF